MSGWVQGERKGDGFGVCGFFFRGGKKERSDGGALLCGGEGDERS